MRKVILVLSGLFILGTLGPVAALAGSIDAVVYDTILYAPRNNPPVRNNLDFELFKVDGAPIQREIPLPFEDIKPGALVSPGTHQFTVHAFPLGRRPDTVPSEVTFTATVDPNKRYLIGSIGDIPILVERRVTVTAQDGTMATGPIRARALLPFLGFKMTFKMDFTTHTLNSVTVVEVGSGSFAEEAGVKVGDDIVAMNGKAIAGMQPIELTTFISRRPPKGETFDYQFSIERGLLKKKVLIAFTAGNPGNGVADSQMPNSQVDLESSDAGWGLAVGGVNRLTLHGVIASFEMYKIWADNPDILLYRVTQGSSLDIGHEDLVWRIPYHEPFKHTVPSFAKWSPPKPSEDAKKAGELTDKFITELSEK